MGLVWIPLVIGIQLILLYAFLGGPNAFLGKLAAGTEFTGSEGWTRMQVGLPLAAILAFPSLLVLAVVEKLVHPVGLLDIVAIQGLSVLALLRWLHARTAPVTPAAAAGTRYDRAEFSPDEPAASLPTPDVIVPVAEPLHNIHQPGSPVMTGAIRIPSPPAPPGTPPPPVTWDMAIETLRRTYQWDDIGLWHSFARIRTLRLDELQQANDDACFDPAKAERLRYVAREVLVGFMTRKSVPFRNTQPPDSLLGIDDHEVDVMHRLALSITAKHPRLFIDTGDIELCSERRVLRMYQMALFEAHALMQAKRSNSTLH